MDPEFERMIHNKNTLSEIREATDKNPGLTAALKDSMSSPLITIGGNGGVEDLCVQLIECYKGQLYIYIRTIEHLLC